MILADINPTDIVNIIVALSSLAAAVLAGVAAVYAARAKVMAGEAKDDIAIVKTATNHMKDELVKVTRLESFQAGRVEGQAAAKEVSEAVAEAVAVVEARRPAEMPPAFRGEPLGRTEAIEKLGAIEQHTKETAASLAKVEPQEVKVVNTLDEKVPVVGGPIVLKEIKK